MGGGGQDLGNWGQSAVILGQKLVSSSSSSCSLGLAWDKQKDGVLVPKFCKMVLLNSLARLDVT